MFWSVFILDIQVSLHSALIEYHIFSIHIIKITAISEITLLTFLIFETVLFSKFLD